MLNRIVIVVVLLVFFGLALLSPRPETVAPEQGFTPLFNGYSLEGWRKIGGDSTFRAERGEIIGSHGPGENTFLRTQQVFDNFVLKMDMRWEEPGNSGVLFRAQQRNGDGRAYGYQYELDHNARAWSGGVYDEARRGWLQNLEQNQAAREAIKLEGWNQVVIEASGPYIKTWINGVLAADIVDMFDGEGFIALQVHAGDVGVMRWRNIRIKALQAIGIAGEPLDGRRQLSAFSVDFELPVCEKPRSVKLRRARAIGGDYQYIELQIDQDSAQAFVQYAQGRDELDVAYLDNVAASRRVRVVAQGQRVTLSVGEMDVARLDDVDLPDRGSFVVEATPCAEDFDLASLDWIDLRPRDQELQFYQTLDTAPAPVLTPAQALDRFRIAPGFEIELVAAEPLIGDPVAMAWDEYGRLYVVEMRSYMPDAYGSGRFDPVGRVVRLEDTDGDGQMDASEVFLDKLANPRAVAVTNAGILVAEPPNLWLCELPARDAICSNKRSLGDYGLADGDGNVEHLENKLLPGLDNWYYNSKSGRKLRIVDGQMESRHSLFRGQWGIARDNVGRLYYNHNSNLITADFFAAEDLFDELTFVPAPGLGEVLTAPEEVFSVRVNPGVNRAYLEGTLRPDGRLHQATSASGLTPYRGNQMPAAMLGQIFVAEPAANVVAQFEIAENELELRAEHLLYEDPDWGQREFLAATDERFRPVDVLNGPDGGLYIIDMYRGLIQDEHFLTEELRDQVLQRQLDAPIGLGRIWRVKHSAGTDTTVPELATASPAALVQLLGHDNGWVRDTAQRLLLRTPGVATGELKALAVSENSLGALHALWALQGRSELNRETTLGAFSRDDYHRQVQALRAGRGLLRSDDLLSMAESSAALAPAVRMQLAFALGDHIVETQVRLALLQLLATDIESAYLRQAVVRATRGEENEFLAQLLADTLVMPERESVVDLVKGLAVSAYNSNLEASAELLQLLAMVQAQSGERQWLQLAMLEGFRSVTHRSGFTPVSFAASPPIFTDSSIDETNPLWQARLQARRAFTWPGDELAAGITPLGPTQLALQAKGAAFYPACGACHGQDGGGIAGLGPALTDSARVNGAPEHLGRIILQGLDTERNGVMPPHNAMRELDDETLAGLMLYLRRSWGNSADPVSLEMTASIRQASSDRTTPWTVAELDVVEVDRGYDRFEGKYKVSFITMTVTQEGGALHLSVPMYGGGPLQEEAEGVFSASLEGESLKIEFQINDDGSVPAFVLYRDGQKIPVPRI